MEQWKEQERSGTSIDRRVRMPSPASLKNLKPWRPGQSGNPKSRPGAPKFTEADRHEIVVALAAVFDEPTQRAAIKRLRAALTTPRTVPKSWSWSQGCTENSKPHHQGPSEHALCSMLGGSSGAAKPPPANVGRVRALREGVSWRLPRNSCHEIRLST